MTDVSAAEREVVLLRVIESGDNWPPLGAEDKELEEDMADVALLNC